MRFAIFGNSSSPETDQTAVKFLKLLVSSNDGICMDNSYRQHISMIYDGVLPPIDVFHENDFHAHAAISIGGDGTFLRTAARVGAKQIPILGINTGRLGFLADITVNQTEWALSQLKKGNYSVQERDLLQIHMEGIPKHISPFALNDVAILKHDMASTISIKTAVDGTPLATCLADGLVVATPTGSTAYSLSVGGPIIAPGTKVMELVPVAPHSLNMRPIVISQEQTITLSVSSRSHKYLVSIDGKSFSCPEGREIKISKAPYQVNIIKFHESDFFSTLREKMMWGADCRR